MQSRPFPEDAWHELCTPPGPTTTPAPPTGPGQGSPRASCVRAPWLPEGFRVTRAESAPPPARVPAWQREPPFGPSSSARSSPLSPHQSLPPILRARHRGPMPWAPLRKRNARPCLSHSQTRTGQRLPGAGAYLRAGQPKSRRAARDPAGYNEPGAPGRASLGRRGRATSGTRALAAPGLAFCVPPRPRPRPRPRPEQPQRGRGLRGA